MQMRSHIPVRDSGALRVTCVGSFLDGRSAAGITARVFDKHDHMVFIGTVELAGAHHIQKTRRGVSHRVRCGPGNVLTLLASDMTLAGRLCRDLRWA